MDRNVVLIDRLGEIERDLLLAQRLLASYMPDHDTYKAYGQFHAEISREYEAIVDRLAQPHEPRLSQAELLKQLRKLGYKCENGCIVALTMTQRWMKRFLVDVDQFQSVDGAILKEDEDERNVINLVTTTGRTAVQIRYHTLYNDPPAVSPPPPPPTQTTPAAADAVDVPHSQL